jgi:hypothetical protein
MSGKNGGFILYLASRRMDAGSWQGMRETHRQ